MKALKKVCRHIEKLLEELRIPLTSTQRAGALSESPPQIRTFELLLRIVQPLSFGLLILPREIAQLFVTSE
jgi:hypothetical protein